jgi:RND family efflux transporter MFP subunit
LLLPVWFLLIPAAASGQQGAGPPKTPVRVAPVETRAVSEQITLIGTTEAIAESTVASEIAGIVEEFPVREGDFVNKGDLLARLRVTYLKLRLEGARAARERTVANLKNAEKELKRVTKLRETRSVAEKAYDEALYNYQALTQELLRNEAEIDQLQYEISHTAVKAPMAGFVSEEHTQVGEWLNTGGGVVTLVDLSQVLITVDVPERYAVKLSRKAPVDILIRSVAEQRLQGTIYAVLPQGNPAARTFPVRTHLDNPDLLIKSGMEAHVTFSLSDKFEALLVPKDAIVAFGDTRQVVTVADGRAKPVMVRVTGYYGSDVAVEGDLKPGDAVVIRGNERLRPGQEVVVQN